MSQLDIVIIVMIVMFVIGFAFGVMVHDDFMKVVVGSIMTKRD